MAVGITENDVWRAADALLLEGLRPTIERVRQKIGRGSPNTVSPYLETWFKSLGARIKDPGAFSAPADIPDPIQVAAKHLWDTALSTARADVEVQTRAIRAELEEESERLEILRRAMEAKEAALEGQLHSHARALEAAGREAETLRGRVSDQNRLLERQTDELNIVRAEVTSVRGELTDVLRRLNDEREQWTADRQALEVRHQAMENRWAQEVDRAREATKRTEAGYTRERAELTKHIAQAQEREQELKADAEVMHQREKNHLSELGDLGRQFKDLTDEHVRRLDVHRQRENELLQRAERAENQLEGALRQLTEKGNELAHLVSSLVKQNMRRTQHAKASKQA